MEATQTPASVALVTPMSVTQRQGTPPSPARRSPPQPPAQPRGSLKGHSSAGTEGDMRVPGRSCPWAETNSCLQSPQPGPGRPAVPSDLGDSRLGSFLGRSPLGLDPEWTRGAHGEVRRRRGPGRRSGEPRPKSCLHPQTFYGLFIDARSYSDITELTSYMKYFQI